MSRLFTSLLTLVQAAAVVAGPTHHYRSPQQYTAKLESTPVTLNADARVLTLDFSSEVELKFSEEYNGLWSQMSDGPWLYSYGLMSSFRTETFNITGAGNFQSYFLQGGQRWMTVTLVTGNSLTIRTSGIEASVNVIDPQDLAGMFNSSNSTFDAVWGLGTRAV
ncbi:hypothetical protein SEUCBS139899_005582 [Sporothrix eucalyptigena]|uniref:Uncharacterized protein n=1 Tax=Sporothrix eucalyptigena TaxID=1812306 RepID=A0ABP0C326_9PEZI